MNEGNYPTIATAVSAKHWYSWTSEYVLRDKFRWANEPHLQDLIPLETKPGKIVPPEGKWQPRLIIGHNVGFDRAFVKEQYLTQGTQLRFLDTMSMHIAICGQTSFQRLLYKASGKGSHRKEVIEHANKQKLFNRASSEEWKKISGMNNLSDVFQLHCGEEPLEKSKRDIFVEGTMADVRDQFQELMTYCASDVRATKKVFTKLWPEFQERFPHPVTLAGMLEMGSAYLPLNSAWPRYIQQANSTYDEMQRELKKLLMNLADEACLLLQDEEYKNDPWLWDLDWSTSAYKLKKNGSAASISVDPFEETDTDLYPFPDRLKCEEGEVAVEEYRRVVRKVYATASRVPKNPTFMPGYPVWYKDLCPRPNEPDFYPGPSNISTQSRVTPKLMRLTWEGFPVHYDDKHGWGYLVPHQEELSEVEQELRNQEGPEQKEEAKFPLQAFLEFLKQSKPEECSNLSCSHSTIDVLNTQFDENAMDLHEKLQHWDTAMQGKPKKKKKFEHTGVGPYNIGIPGVRFYKIPHKDGEHNRVGNPLARDYLMRSEDGTLKTSTGSHANRALVLGRMCSYWKNNQKRIMGQMCVWLNKSELDRTVTRHVDYEVDGLYGAIIPRIVTAGTITRRAVEPTWLTASNAYKDRIGSELKSMIQSPPGYHFVGADVDSQELWIAAVLGDAYFMREHGCTALGWMTLQGNKSDKTDLHSKTAEIAEISRDHAKVLNYGRIYGAGQTFAERLLQQFNPQLSDQEAKLKAANMYKQTKGQRNESFMFNALESVANSETPVTPVLGCRISKALEPRYVLDDFLTSRVNWVVQSSAVDYLHLMLVCMRWLLSSPTTGGIKGRFCVSIHDEVRYLVASPDRYRAALALQVTNLFVRAMFTHRLGMQDLPQ
ncbi:DNA polymerase subunit gamma-1, partial [Plakobranchus ocellatus]